MADVDRGSSAGRQGVGEDQFAARRTELARLLMIASAVSALAVALYSSWTIVFAPEPTHMYWVAAVYGLGSVATAVSIRRGRVRFGSAVFVAMNWACATAFLVAEGPQTGHLGIYFVAVILAGLLLAARMAVIAALAAAVAVGSVVIAVSLGFEPPGMTSAEGNWSKVIAQLVVAGVLTALVTRGLHRALNRLAESHSRMSEQNAALRKGREQLEKSQRYAATLVESSPDGVVVVDTAGRVHTANNAALRMFGDDCVSRTVEDLGWLEPGEPLDALATPRRVELSSPRLVLDFRGSAVDTVESGPGWQVTIRDVTQGVDAQAREQALEDRLRVAQRLEAIGSLAGGVAHDFNNLLTVIIASSDSILHDAQGPDEVRERAAEIAAAGASAARVARQLLSLSRRPEGTAKPVDAARQIGDMEPLLKRLLGTHITLSTDIVGPACVCIEPAQLEQVVLNLVVNAQDAMPSGGTIEIRVRAEPGEAGTVSPRVLIEVADDGPGMTAEVRARIFQPFFTTKAEGRGTGLGLALVERLVLEADGQIEIDTAPGRGTAFQIRLPAAAQPLAATAQGAPHVRVGRGEHIVVVEDEAQVRRVTRAMLERAGYEVSTCSDALELERLIENGVEPALLLTDVILPHLSGPEAVARMRGLGLTVPVVYMSGYTGTHLSEQGVATDVRLLAKPFTSAELVGHVSDALANHAETVSRAAGLPG